MRNDANRKHFGVPPEVLMLLAGLFGCSADSPTQAVTPSATSATPGTGATQAGSTAAAASGSVSTGESGRGASGMTTSTSGTSGTAGVAAGTGIAMPTSGTGGTLGASGASASAGSGGMAGASGVGDSAGASGSDMMTTYPQLEASEIGTPMQIANGFSLAESPLWDPCNHRLLFPDVSAPGGGVINSLDADGKVTQFMSNTGNTNGMAWAPDGSLILAQMAGHVARRDPSGMVTVIDQDGTKLNTPDDVVVRSDGTIYLSDGDFCPIGSLLGYSTSLPVYTIKPNTTTLINSGMVRGPNGIELSPDEKLLYVNGYGEGTIYRFDVMPDGSIMKQSAPFATGLTDPDSMCLDAAGNIYVAVGSGVQVFRPDGSKVTLIPITAPAGSCTKAGPTNCTFGGDDGKTLYITTWTTIWKIDNMPIPGLDWIVGKQRAKCM